MARPGPRSSHAPSWEQDARGRAGARKSGNRRKLQEIIAQGYRLGSTRGWASRVAKCPWRKADFGRGPAAAACGAPPPKLKTTKSVRNRRPGLPPGQHTWRGEPGRSGGGFWSRSATIFCQVYLLVFAARHSGPGPEAARFSVGSIIWSSPCATRALVTKSDTLPPYEEHEWKPLV